MPSTCGLVAMTSPSHGEGRQFDPGQVYIHNYRPIKTANFVAPKAKCMHYRQDPPCVDPAGSDDPGRTRTCNLWFRRPTPYPLGHRANV